MRQLGVFACRFKEDDTTQETTVVKGMLDGWHGSGSTLLVFDWPTKDYIVV